MSFSKVCLLSVCGVPTQFFIEYADSDDEHHVTVLDKHGRKVGEMSYTEEEETYRVESLTNHTRLRHRKVDGLGTYLLDILESRKPLILTSTDYSEAFYVKRKMRVSLELYLNVKSTKRSIMGAKSRAGQQIDAISKVWFSQWYNALFERFRAV